MGRAPVKSRRIARPQRASTAMVAAPSTSRMPTAMTLLVVQRLRLIGQALRPPATPERRRPRRTAACPPGFPTACLTSEQSNICVIILHHLFCGQYSAVYAQRFDKAGKAFRGCTCSRPSTYANNFRICSLLYCARRHKITIFIYRSISACVLTQCE